MINHIISECSKLAQEYKTRHDWVGKVIHWKISKKFKFDHRNKYYMHNQAYVHENETHKLLWDFDIQTDHLISAWRPELIKIHKKKKQENYHWGFSDFCLHRYIHNVSADMSPGLLQVFVWTRKFTQDSEPRRLVNPRESLLLIPWAIIRYKW